MGIYIEINLMYTSETSALKLAFIVRLDRIRVCWIDFDEIVYEI